MNRRRYNKLRSSNSRIKEIIFSHVENNLRGYRRMNVYLAGPIFCEGDRIRNEKWSAQIRDAIPGINLYNPLENKEINDMLLLKDSIKKNVVLALILWFMGSTVIGISIVYLVIAFRGFCLGYTISSVIATCGLWKGILFILSTVFLQNRKHPQTYWSLHRNWYCTT